MQGPLLPEPAKQARTCLVLRACVHVGATPGVRVRLRVHVCAAVGEPVQGCVPAQGVAEGGTVGTACVCLVLAHG